MVGDLLSLLPLILMFHSQSMTLDRAHSWAAFGVGSVQVVQYDWEGPCLVFVSPGISFVNLGEHGDIQTSSVS